MSTPRANLAVADRGPRDHARRVTSAVSSSLSPFWAFERDKPWELGETFDAYAADGRLGKARVLGIWGKIVVAVFLPDSALWLPDDYLARLDTVMTFIDNEGLPILKAALGEAHPYTSVDADQLLILLSQFYSLDEGITSSSQFGDVVESLIDINVRVLSSTNYALYIFGHEIAHAWQSRYHLETRNSPTGLSGAGDNWAQEGGATFLGYELVRHRIGIGLLDNWEWYPLIWRVNDESRQYGFEVAHANGYFLEGYEASASFIRDLVTRLVVAGVSYETAIANVSRGVIEGWWGVDLFGNVRTGLTQRMRSLLDPEWHPVEAVLVWTASQALDERLESEIFTNRAFKHVADVEEVYFPNCSGGTGYGWHTQGWLITGRGVGTENTCFLKNTTALVGTLDRGMLSTFMYILDDNVGGTYQLSGEAEMPEWMLVRYR